MCKNIGVYFFSSNLMKMRKKTNLPLLYIFLLRQIPISDMWSVLALVPCRLVMWGQCVFIVDNIATFFHILRLMGTRLEIEIIIQKAFTTKMQAK